MESRHRLQDWHHMLVMCLVMAVLAGGSVYLFLHINFTPYPASMEREMIDLFIQVLFAIASFIFSVIVTVLVYVLLFFRRPPGDDSDAKLEEFKLLNSSATAQHIQAITPEGL